jgi:phospholipid/cholesterol/gamma-HCH transport system substrate-binding protein
VNRAADDTARAARQMSRAAGGVTENPQLFIYGAGRIQPGPGEAGFAP